MTNCRKQCNLFVVQIRKNGRVGWKSDTLLVLKFPLLLDTLYLQFLFAHVSFFTRRHSSA